MSAPIRAEGGGELSWSDLRLRAVTGDYFEAAGLDVLQGRGFGPADVEGGPLVAVVSAVVADRLWPGGEAVGRTLELGSPGGGTVQVVGVVEDHRTLGGGAPGGGGFRLEPLPFLYLPEAQTILGNPGLVVRPAPAARDRIGAIVRDVVHEVDARQAVGDVRTLGASEDALRTAFRTIAALMLGLAVAGAGLAVLGIWGVIAQAVARRTREIGIRTAIGGSAGRIVAGIMAGGLRVTLLGLLVGLALALLLTRVLGSVLYQVDPLDPAVLACTAGLFVTVGVLATYLPARRAARVDPVGALRSE